jgi:hypothetical protein
MAVGGSRTLKLALLAEVADFSKNIKQASSDTQSIGDQFDAFGKKAALAFAAAAAAIGAFAVASVKAAAEDEVGQKKLEETIRNTTNATAEQIAGIDKYITSQSIATATTDDVLRPALSRLILATKDVTKAQDLLSLAQEISVARNKPLEAVTNALGKAYEGSNTALGKLGIGIDAATLKTLSFDETQQLLNKTFDGFIENQSETAAFKFKQLTIAIDETKEQIGAALLPVITELTDYILMNVVPVVQSFVDGLTGKDGLNEGLSDTQISAENWGKNIRGLIKTVINFKDELIVLGGVIAAVFTVSKISAGVTATIAAIKLLMTAYNALKASAIVTGVATAFALNPLLGVGAVALAAAVLSGANALANNSNIDLDSMDLSGGAGGLGFPSGFTNFGSGYTTPVTGTFRGPTDESIAQYGSGPDQAAAKARIAAKESGTVLTSPFNAGSFRVGEAATMAAAAAAASLAANDAANAARIAAQTAVVTTPTIVVNVSGAVDSEGTARTIVNTLNESFFRGTGGANALAFE